MHDQEEQNKQKMIYLSKNHMIKLSEIILTGESCKISTFERLMKYIWVFGG